MHIFKYDQRSFPLQFIEHRAEYVLAAGAGIDGRRQITLGLARDIMQGRKRPGRKQRIARTP